MLIETLESLTNKIEVVQCGMEKCRGIATIERLEGFWTVFVQSAVGNDFIRKCIFAQEFVDKVRMRDQEIVGIQ